MKRTHCDDISIIEAAVTRITKADLQKSILLVDRAVLMPKMVFRKFCASPSFTYSKKSIANFIKKVAEVDSF